MFDRARIHQARCLAKSAMLELSSLSDWARPDPPGPPCIGSKCHFLAKWEPCRFRPNAPAANFGPATSTSPKGPPTPFHVRPLQTAHVVLSTYSCGARRVPRRFVFARLAKYSPPDGRADRNCEITLEEFNNYTRDPVLSNFSPPVANFYQVWPIACKLGKFGPTNGPNLTSIATLANLVAKSVACGGLRTEFAPQIAPKSNSRALLG